MKKITVYLLCLILVFSAQINIFAVGEGNIDGGGGGLGQGTSENYWIGGDDGVRVTIIRDKDSIPISTPLDFTNKQHQKIQVHFGKVSKIEYRNGSHLNLDTGTYTYNNPEQPLPRIVSSNGSINIDAIKSYFTDEQIIRSLAIIEGLNYESLINGQYKLLLEPIAYFTYGGLKVAMTAHEAALFDQQLDGKLRSSMSSLTHKNLPLAIFLETSDLGFPAWDGPTTERVSDDQIISSLGLGIVRFRDADTPVVIGESDFEYRVNTDVITSVTVNTGSRITSDNAATLTFNINGSSYSITDIVIPEGESQVVWVKWHTPIYPTTLIITANVNSGFVSRTAITAKIVDLNEKVPPNPTADDTKPSGYSIPDIPTMHQKTSASWGLWGCYWKADWIWEAKWDWTLDGEDNGYWEDNGEWIDRGDWEYTYTGYSANVTASMTVTPDTKVPTAYGKTMRSGYGINMNVKTSLQSNAPSSSITGAQNVLSYYPEFNYNTYLRLSDMVTGGYSAEFELKPNEFSTYERRVHFTPLWFPDGRYSIVANVIDVWTPVGMLSCQMSDYVNIQGNLYDDWHIAPKL